MLVQRCRRQRRDDSGAVAVMYALLLTVVLIPISALGVDLGNAVARRTHIQSQADFGAFAAATELTGSESAGDAPAAVLVDEVVASLNANQPQDDDRACWRTQSCVTATMLTDGDLTNGEVRHLSGGRTQVSAPEAYVDFALSGSMGFDGVDVDGSATVKIKSGGLRVMPMFAVSGCDYGRQTLTDPAGPGPSPSGVPPLAFDSDSNETTLQSGGLTAYDSGGSVVPNLVLNSTGNVVTLSAKKWKATTKIGFFREPATTPVVEQPSFSLDGATPAVDLAPYTSSPPGAVTTVRLRVPDSVAAVESVWYIRVYNAGTQNKWSARSEALALRVGTPVLECAAGAVDGNFGTLIFPRNDGPPSDNLPVNIAEGLQPPLTPHTHDWAVDNPLADGFCYPGPNGTPGLNDAIESEETDVLVPLTNCVDTDTGLTSNVATQGLISGAGVYSGLLTRAETRSGCDPNGGSDERSVDTGPGPDDVINDDILSCFLSNGSTSLADVSSPTYAGGPAFIPELFESPRFIQVPVLKRQPDSGGSNRYSIVDFRPGFITDEVVAASTIKGTSTATADNGLTITSSGISTIKVVFFNRTALPNSDDIPLMDYLGVGPPIPVLVD